MLSFLKILFSNFAKGPSTDSFPFKEARTPERFRGRVTMDSSRCVGCAICHHVCPGDAIRIEPNAEKTGYSFTIWHNSCALCGLCRHFCPTKAISMTNDWHNAHTQENKYDWAEHHFVPYLKCAGCGTAIRILPPELATRLYAHSPVDMNEIMKLCPACRQVAAVRKLEQQAKHESLEKTFGEELPLAESAPEPPVQAAPRAEAAAPVKPEPVAAEPKAEEPAPESAAAAPKAAEAAPEIAAEAAAPEQAEAPAPEAAPEAKAAPSAAPSVAPEAKAEKKAPAKSGKKAPDKKADTSKKGGARKG